MKSNDKNKPSHKNGSEPTTGSSAVPIWLVLVFGILFYWSSLYLDAHTGSFNPMVHAPYRSYDELASAQPVEKGGELIALGKKVYQIKANCQGCHQPNGLGSSAPLVPPLAKSEYVLAKKPDRLVRIVLHGLNGTVNVAGKAYEGVNMPPIGTLAGLTDEEVAAVLSFIRQNKDWGNNGAAVTVDQVKAIRAAIKDRQTQWTPEELNQVPEG